MLRITPKLVQAGSACLAKLPEWEQALFLIMACAAIALFFLASSQVDGDEKGNQLDKCGVFYGLFIALFGGCCLIIVLAPKCA